MKLLRHEKRISFTSQEDINKKEIEAYDMEYFTKVKEIMQKLQNVDQEYHGSDEQELMKELYMRDLRSLDSARESFQENLKKEKFSSPEMGEDFKSLSNFVLDQDDSAALRRQNTERVVRSRAESFSDQNTKDLD